MAKSQHSVFLKIFGIPEFLKCGSQSPGWALRMAVLHFLLPLALLFQLTVPRDEM